MVFCKANKFSEEKMTIIMELMHYLMRQLINMGDNIDEEQSYENFKSLLLRHAIHRPPHSLAILDLEEVKKIDLHAQDTFFRHFDMYKYCLTVRDEMRLKTENLLTNVEPNLPDINGGETVKLAANLKQLGEYFSEEQCEAMRKEEEYLMHGAGKIERILNEEMERLQKDMSDQIAKQDDEFLAKIGKK